MKPQRCDCIGTEGGTTKAFLKRFRDKKESPVRVTLNDLTIIPSGLDAYDCPVSGVGLSTRGFSLSSSLPFVISLSSWTMAQFTGL